MRFFVYMTLAVLLASYAAEAQKATAVAVAASGSFRHRNKCTQPDPPVASVGWARISSFGSCTDACFNFGVAPIASPSPGPLVPGNQLCRFSYTPAAGGSSVTIYGNYVEDPAEGPICLGRHPVDGDVFLLADDNFFCGCCGTLNRKGRRYNTGCNIVTAFVAAGATCPAGRPWTEPAGGQICTVASPLIGAPSIFGTIVGTPATCAAPGGVGGAFQRLCYRINAYAGPPAPDCDKRGN